MKHIGTFHGTLTDLLKNLPNILKGVIEQDSKPIDYSEAAAEAAAKTVDWRHLEFRMRLSEYYANPTKENYYRVMGRR